MVLADYLKSNWLLRNPVSKSFDLLIRQIYFYDAGSHIQPQTGRNSINTFPIKTIKFLALSYYNYEYHRDTRNCICKRFHRHSKDRERWIYEYRKNGNWSIASRWGNIWNRYRQGYTDECLVEGYKNIMISEFLLFIYRIKHFIQWVFSPTIPYYRFDILLQEK